MISRSFRTATSLSWGVAALFLLTAAAAVQDRTPSEVNPIPVLDSTGKPMAAPFLGGLDVPRPQLIDIDTDGDLDLFLQERIDDLMYFENVSGVFTWRTNRFQNLPVGEWYRFVDFDHDGLMDLFTEMQVGYARFWRNAGTPAAARMVALGDSLRDPSGKAISIDRQNIPTLFDVDCNGRLDLFVGRVEGVVDRYEQQSIGPDGAPRFELHTPRWENIEILGGEAGTSLILSDSGGPSAAEPKKHGANTLAFADVDGTGISDLYWGDFFEAGLLRIRNQGTCAAPNYQGIPERFPHGSMIMTSGYNAPAFGDIDRDGNMDLVLGVIGGAYGPNVTAAQNLYLLKQAPKGKWTTTTRQFVSQVDVGSESTPALADIDGDGDLDLLIGNKISPDNLGTASITHFENTGTATEPVFRWRGVLPVNGHFNYAPAIVDLDSDGLLDLVLGTWRDQIQWYRNVGTRTAPNWTLKDTALVTITRGSNTTPAFGDLDGDGLTDLVIGEATGLINLYRNTGTAQSAKFELVSDHFQDIKPGRRSAPTVADFDRDGKLDLVIGSEEGHIEFWRNLGKAPKDFHFERDSTRTIRSFNGASPAVGSLRGPAKGMVLISGTSAGGLRWFELK